MKISLDEIQKSINFQRNNKPRGNSGLPAKFYIHFSNELAPVLSDVYNSWGKLGTMRVTFRAGITSARYKKGDKKILQTADPFYF